jgi:uncharacterized protein YqeY
MTSALSDRLQSDLTAAMKRRDETVVGTLRMVRAAVMNAAVAGSAAVELDDEQVMAVLRSEAKKRVEAAEIYTTAGRQELAAQERSELAVIEAYLPAAMDDDALSAIVAEEVAVAAAAGQTGGRAMGVVVKAVRARVGDAAEGGRIAALVKSHLA